MVDGRSSVDESLLTGESLVEGATSEGIAQLADGTTDFPVRMYVDWVRVYKKTG